MSSDQTPSERSAEFRRALVATANLAPYVRRRPPLKLVVAALAAFVVAGALTGGAIATANRPNPQTLSAQADAASGAKSFMRDVGGTLIGEPFIRSSSGTTSVDLGTRPTGATSVVEGFSCFAPARFEGKLDTNVFARWDCTSAPSGGASYDSVGRNGDHKITIRALHPGPFSIWISWVRIPTYTASKAEKLELSDGIVTRDEDEAAFSRYQGCMGALGHAVSASANFIVPTMGDSSGDGSSNRCYQTEWQAVDEKWQSELMQSDLGTNSIDACLATQGVAPAATPQARWAQLDQLVMIQSRCPWVG